MRRVTLGLLVLACIDHEHVLSSCHGTPLEPIGSKVLPQAFYDDDFQSERTAAQLFKRFVSNGRGDEDVKGDADGHSESHHSVSSRSDRRNARASQSAPARAAVVNVNIRAGERPHAANPCVADSYPTASEAAPCGVDRLDANLVPSPTAPEPGPCIADPPDAAGEARERNVIIHVHLFGRFARTPCGEPHAPCIANKPKTPPCGKPPSWAPVARSVSLYAPPRHRYERRACGVVCLCARVTCGELRWRGIPCRLAARAELTMCG
jgi:hypothetical protein